jgi:MoaA/NifB/PqqE/SkfB family radical SAM enzyme
MKEIDNKIRFTWDIHYKCNFRCPYCWFYNGWAQASRLNVYLSPQEWMVHWERIFKRYGPVHIEITGGEPFIYPNFIELVRQLSGIHTVKVTTNLSGDIKAFAQKIDPRRVSLDINYHPLFAQLEGFIKKVLILKRAGFKGGVCYLAYPPQMRQMDSIRKQFEDAGISFALAAFWGEYRGVKYPQGYTEKDRELIRPYLGQIDRITYHLDGKSPKGKLCNAGFRYAGIKANGAVVRCGPLGDVVLGNIMEEDFKLFDRPLPCQAESCPCNEYVNLIEAEPADAVCQDTKEASGKKEQDERALGAYGDREGARPSSATLPDFRIPHPPYRVHWNWELSYRCNYTCSYCPWWEKGKEDKDVPIEIGVWKDVWNRIFESYGCCHVRFSGGEPTIYPEFFELVRELLNMHTIDITTNLSFDLDGFLRRIRPGGISISASFHPEFDHIDPFLEKVQFLHNSGYPSSIAYVAYPPHLEKVRFFKSKAEEKGIIFKVIPFNGEFKGKRYPQDYTVQERCLMEGVARDAANQRLNELNSRWLEWNVKRNPGEKNKKGRLCRMGQMYAKIYPDHTVTRCCALDEKGSPIGVLGNILDADFRLHDEPQPCQVQSCPCFKSMLVGDEEDKWVPLWEGPEHPLYKLPRKLPRGDSRQ